jgi:chloramphenicol O-acetyltransferase type A
VSLDETATASDERYQEYARRGMRYIDMSSWDRRSHFERYVGADFPYFIITGNVDVTNLLSFSRSHSISSYLAVVFAAHRTAESIENFRYRIVDGRPILNDRMCPSFTYLPKGSDLFIYVTVDFVDDIHRFHEVTKAQIAAQGTDLGWEMTAGRHDTIGYSGLPWIQYTHFTRSIVKAGLDSNPKISWGKYFAQGERTLMPLSVQVHHGLMDGLHVGRYFEALQRYITDLA